MLLEHLDGCFLSGTIHDAPVTEIAALVTQIRAGCEDLPGYGASRSIQASSAGLHSGRNGSDRMIWNAGTVDGA